MDQATPAIMEEESGSNQIEVRVVPGWMIFLVNLTVGLIESIYLWWVIREHAELESFLALHVGIVLLLLVWHAWCRRSYKAYLLPTFTLLFTTCLGPLGALATAYAIVAREFFLLNFHPYQEMWAKLFPQESGHRSSQLYEQLMRMDPKFETDDNITPLMDVITHGSAEQKQAAIVLMARHYIPPFTAVLKKALMDENPTIRVMAGTAISQIEKNFAEETGVLEQDLQYDAYEESYLAAGIHYDHHAYTGLLEPAQARLYRTKAMEYYRKYLDFNPRDITAIKEVGRLMIRDEDLDGAMEWFEKYRRLGSSSPSFLTWDMEVLFEKGKFEQVRHMMRTHGRFLLESHGFPPSVMDTVKLWIKADNEVPHMTERADICLIIEGGYPFADGGVAMWTDALIRNMSKLTFHLCLLLPPGQKPKQVFELPDNVIDTTITVLQDLPQGSKRKFNDIKTLGELLQRFQQDGGLAEVKRLNDLFAPQGANLGTENLLNSRWAWDMMMALYESTNHTGSFVDFFWSWRALAGGLYSVMLAEIPQARVYHAVSTGYAGLLLARAAIEKKRPALLTEHGIYTNERRIEIAMSSWLAEVRTNRYSIENVGEQLREMWVRSFVSYSQACYQASSEVITLFEENQAIQLKDGAEEHKVRIIPNGIDIEKFSALSVNRPDHSPTIALIGRVLPVKDILSFIRAAGILHQRFESMRILILGGIDEDPTYYQQCCRLVEFLGLSEFVSFEGTVDVAEYLPIIDVLVLTSISEGQPLVILEAGAAGIPIVATDVGACRELVKGARWEKPMLGPAGAITELADPRATADAVSRLFEDPSWYERCSRNIKERIARYYNQAELSQTYQRLFDHYIQAEQDEQGGFPRWQA